MRAPDALRSLRPRLAMTGSAKDEGLGQTGLRRLLIFGIHVLGSLGHRRDHRIEIDTAVGRDFVARDQISSPRFDRAERAAFDARYLHEPGDWIAGHAEMMF